MNSSPPTDDQLALRILDRGGLVTPKAVETLRRACQLGVVTALRLRLSPQQWSLLEIRLQHEPRDAVHDWLVELGCDLVTLGQQALLDALGRAYPSSASTHHDQPLALRARVVHDDSSRRLAGVGI